MAKLTNCNSSLVSFAIHNTEFYYLQLRRIGTIFDISVTYKLKEAPNLTFTQRVW